MTKMKKDLQVKSKFHDLRNFLPQCGKFEIFSLTQILRELKVGQSKVSKSAILTHLEALNFDFYAFLHILKAEIHQINILEPLKWRKLQF